MCKQNNISSLIYAMFPGLWELERFWTEKWLQGHSVSADVHRPRLRSTDHGDLVVPRANTDRFGRRGFSVSGRTSGTSCHLTFGKCPINQNNLLEHWKLFYFQTAPTSTSADNIKRRAIAKTSTSTSTGHAIGTIWKVTHDLLLIFHCNHVSILYRLGDIIKIMQVSG